MASAMTKAARKSTSPLLYWLRSSDAIALFSTEAMAIEPAKAVQAEPAENGNGVKGKGGLMKINNFLYRKISGVGGHPAEEVSELVDEWVQKGNLVTKYQLDRYIHQLRKFNKHRQALQLYKWMDNRGMNMTDSDHAVRLDLVYKCDGIESAETYFEELPEEAKNLKTYGSLLNCFCVERSLEKAVGTVKKMEDRDIELSTLCYNNLMTLHMKRGEHDKVLLLFQSMKHEGRVPNSYSYSFLMSTHAALKDIDAVESVLQEVKSVDGGAHCNWQIYGNVAAIYMASGILDKAESTLEELEKMAPFKDQKPYQYLITLYTRLSNQSSVKRVWELLNKEFPKPFILCYIVMLQSLSKFGDIDGLTKCFEKWESHSTFYDIRLANIVISAYLKEGMLDETKAIMERASKKGCYANFRTFDIYLDFYLESRRYDLALAEFEMAAKKVKKDEWRPNKSKVTKFLAYFEEIKDVDGAEEFCKKLKKLNCVNVDVYNSLIRIYIAAGRSDPGFRQRMEDDKVEIKCETEELLDKL